jgi:hypothetical protein
VLAWMTISSEVLEAEPAPGGDLPSGVLHDFSCAVAGPPLSLDPPLGRVVLSGLEI